MLPVDQMTVPTQPTAEILTGLPRVTKVLLACKARTGRGVTVTVPMAVAVWESVAQVAV